MTFFAFNIYRKEAQAMYDAFYVQRTNPNKHRNHHKEPQERLQIT